MPRRSPRSSDRSLLRLILILVGVFSFVALLSCGLTVYVIYEATRRQVDAKLDAVGLAPLAAPPRELDDALADLCGTDPVKQRAAARWLALQPVDAVRQNEVAGALDPLLNDPDRKTVEAGVWALRKWATRDNVPTVVALLDRTPIEKTDDVARFAMDILGIFPDTNS
jgi:hypothetical protein